MVLHGNTFTQTTSDTRYWHCTKKQSLKCRARVRFDQAGNLKLYHSTHNHDADGTQATDIIPEYSVSKKGKSVIKLDGYTFHETNQTARCSYWRCSGYQRYKCKVTVVTATNGRVKLKKREHNHPLQ